MYSFFKIVRLKEKIILNATYLKLDENELLEPSEIETITLHEKTSNNNPSVTMTKEEAKKEIAKLVKKFNDNISYYQRTDYKETPTRRDFIDPFFFALGWDMDNKEGLSEPFREVVHEYSLETKNSTEAPDYSFRDTDGNNLFFVEAKKPSVHLAKNIFPAYQTRNYAWNARLKISILTDFEELSIYNTTILPKLADKPHIARIKYIPFTDYLKYFDFIWDNLAKENVLSGSINKLLQLKINGHTETVDKIFVKSLDEWREQLAESIAKNNLNLNEDEVNFCVQHFIDRIIFLRIAEDRKVEDKDNLKNCISKGNYYKNFYEYFLIADKKYNSGIFDFAKDTLSSQLKIDNDTIKTIITELYESPYLFNIIPVEILGIAYEQFLGKIIRLTKSHNANIELKPEVRKAGGVYYTPQYIVDYIVKHTVTKQIKGKTPEQINEIKIVDPACGSGSFLLGAYQALLKYHTEYYNAKSKTLKNKKKLPITPDGYLTTQEKKRILLNNIFGVDIDANAVEVTKLSLLLKCMENETRASVQTTIDFRERVLPTLDNNIKCGNSLVNGYYSTGLFDFDSYTEKKLKIFDWKKQFTDVFRQGGFDVVIGNPPYVDSEEMTRSHKELREYCTSFYQTAKGNWDLYCVFIERAFQLIKEKGRFGFIVPNKFIAATYGVHLKKYLSQFKIENLTDYSSVGVFKNNGRNINVYPFVIIAEKTTSSNAGVYTKMKESEKNSETVIKSFDKKITIKKGDVDWASKFNLAEDFIEKIKRNSELLSEHFIVENAATVSEAYDVQELIIQKRLVHQKDFKKIKDFFFINTGIIDKHLNLWKFEKVQYINNSYEKPLMNASKLKKKFPRRYLQSKSTKLILAGMVKELEGIYDEGKCYAAKSTVIITKKSRKYDLKFLQALINSNFYSFLYRAKYSQNQMSGGYINVTKENIINMPLPIIDLKNSDIKKIYDRIVFWVKYMYKADVANINENNVYKMRGNIENVKNQYGVIDQLIYKLYGFSNEEILSIDPTHIFWQPTL